MRYVMVVERKKDSDGFTVHSRLYKIELEEDETFEEFIEHEIEEYKDDPCGVTVVEFTLLNENQEVIEERTVVL